MDKIIKNIFLAIFFSFPFTIISTAQSNTNLKYFTNLIKRIAPQHAGKFAAQIIPAENGDDVFELDCRKGKIILKGNNNNSLAVAFNH